MARPTGEPVCPECRRWGRLVRLTAHDAYGIPYWTCPICRAAFKLRHGEIVQYR